MKKLTKNTISLLVGTSLLSLTGCSAISTEIHHHKLQVSSRMSKSIFLDPVKQSDKVIFVQVHNTSDQKINLRKDIVSNLEDGGWTVTNNIEKAHDLVQVNVLQIGKAPNIQSVWASMNEGYGNALLGGFAGVASGLAMGSVGGGMAVGGVVGGGSWLADQLVSDVTYSMLTDVRVSVRTDGEITQNTKSHLAQGTDTNVSQSYNIKTNWLRYQTRIASVADQVNLDIKDAIPQLTKQTSSEIAGIYS
jgi:hypothetical protein